MQSKARESSIYFEFHFVFCLFFFLWECFYRTDSEKKTVALCLVHLA